MFWQIAIYLQVFSSKKKKLKAENEKFYQLSEMRDFWKKKFLSTVELH